MYSVHILYDFVGQSYYNNSIPLEHLAPNDFDVTLDLFLDDRDLDAALGVESPGIILLKNVESVAKVRAALDRRSWSAKLIVIWNNVWPRRAEFLSDVLQYADFSIFVDRECWENFGRPKGTAYIPLGVDLEIYRQRVPIEERPRRILWMGSRFNSAEKGSDEIALPLRDRLVRNGFECDFRLVDSLSGGIMTRDEMVDWYNSGRVLVCTSSSEAMSSVALEAAACGTALVSTPVGNMPEVIRNEENGLLVQHRHANAFYDAIAGSENTWPSMASSLSRDIRAFDWRTLAQDYFATFRQVVNSDRRPIWVNGHSVPAKVFNGERHSIAAGSGDTSTDASPNKVDLSDRLTVFVSTVGAPSYELCRRMLEQQDCRFQLRIIDNVAPMSAAFQRMLDECGTEFYVQVDEDMLLYPHAVKALYDRMRDQPQNVAVYVEHLFDTQIGRNIQGVKIFRRSIVKHYPLRDVEDFEVDQIHRFSKDGFTHVVNEAPKECALIEAVLGLHGTNFTRRTAYLRYFAIQRQQRQDKAIGWHSLLIELAEQFRVAPTETNFFALAGAAAGMVAPIEPEPKAKDYRLYSETPGFDEAKRLYDHIRRNET